MVRRTQPRSVPPVFRLPLWKSDGLFWWAEATDLLLAIEASGVNEEQIRRRMGFGYGLLADALDGKRLDRHAVALIESGLFPG